MAFDIKHFFNIELPHILEHAIEVFLSKMGHFPSDVTIEQTTENLSTLDAKICYVYKVSHFTPETVSAHIDIDKIFGTYITIYKNSIPFMYIYDNKSFTVDKISDPITNKPIPQTPIERNVCAQLIQLGFFELRDDNMKSWKSRNENKVIKKK